MHRSYRVRVFEVCDTMIDRVADHVLTLPLGWFSAEREAAVVNATSKEVNTLSHLTSMVIPGLCNAFIVPLVMIAATAVVEWPLALIMAAAIVPLVLTWRLMGAATTRANEMEDSASADAAGRLVKNVDADGRVIEIGYDDAGLEASAVGNHEFDKGLTDLTEHVNKRIDGDFPYLGANVYKKGTTTVTDDLRASTVFTKGGVRIGVIGAVTKDLPSLVSPAGLADLTIGDPVEVACRRDQFGGFDAELRVAHTSSFRFGPGTPSRSSMSGLGSGSAASSWPMTAGATSGDSPTTRRPLSSVTR